MTSLTVLFKPVSSKCNLDCGYCYYRASRAENLHVMPLPVARHVIQNLAGDPADPLRIKFIWHGGEPTLAGIEFFRQVCRLQEQVSATQGVIFRNSMQTNGTLLTPRWAEVLKQNMFSIGVSLDGPPAVHDAVRRYPNGSGTCAKVLGHVRRLQDLGLEVGVLATLTQASLGHERDIFSFFREHGIYSFDFLPCYFTGDTSNQDTMAITPEDWSVFMITVFDLWFSADDPRIRVRFLEEVVKGFLGRPPGLCALAGNCHQFVTIEHDGSVYPCDDFVAEENCLGNAARDSLLSILASQRARDFHTTVAPRGGTNCSACSFASLCKGICPRQAPIAERVCAARMALFQHVERSVQHARLVLNQPGGE